MSSFNLTKKLQPARKAWKSFRNRLQSKLRDPKLVKRITTLKQHCSIAWQSIFRFLHRKFLGVTKRPVPPRSHRHLYHHVGRGFSAIYVDELFPGPVRLSSEPGKSKESMAESSSSTSVNKSRPGSSVETRIDGKIQIQGGKVMSAKIPGDDHEKGLGVGKGKAKAGESSRSSGSAEKWKVPMIPQFKGVDERAEEFIAKFRQDMKLEREQSILEFEEMLKRSA